MKFLKGSCDVLNETARYAANSLLIVLGMQVELVLFVAGWDLGGRFNQLANLSDRYLEAGALRRSLFSQDLKGCFLVLAGAVTLFRMPRFLKRLGADLDNHPPREASRD